MMRVIVSLRGGNLIYGTNMDLNMNERVMKWWELGRESLLHQEVESTQCKTFARMPL